MMNHLEPNYDRELYLHDLAFLVNDIQRLLLAADTSNDTSELESDVACRIKTIAVIYTTLYRETRDMDRDSRARVQAILKGEAA